MEFITCLLKRNHRKETTKENEAKRVNLQPIQSAFFQTPPRNLVACVNCLYSSSVKTAINSCYPDPYLLKIAQHN